MPAEADRDWFAQHAQALDTDAEHAHSVVPQLARDGLLGVGVPTALGGSGGDVRDAVLAIASVAEQSLSAAFAFWGQRVVIELLLQTGNTALRERWLAPLLQGERAGASGLSNVMKFLSGIESLNITASAQGEGWVLDGSVPWCTNLRPQGFVVAVAVGRTDGAPPMVVALPSERLGLVRSDDLDLIALRGSNTASLSLHGVAITADDLLADKAPAFLPQARPAFLGLQCGMSIGLARAALAAAGQRVGDGRHVLQAPLHAQRAALDEIVSALLAGLADGCFVAEPHKMFGLRLRLNDVVQQAVQLELQASGGRAYHRSPPGGFARRWREAAFIPIITPSVTQLLGELEKRAATAP